MTIRGLMILVLYAAVACACLDLARRSENETAGMGLIVAALGIPLVVYLSCLTFLVWALMFTASLWGPMILPRSLSHFVVGLYALSPWFGLLILLPQAVWLSRFFPVPCPQCGRRTMIPPTRNGGRPPKENRPWRTMPFYRRCARCGARQRAVRRADVVRSHLVELLPFSRRYDWIDASRPEDDEYWKWVDNSPWRTWAHRAWRTALAIPQRPSRTHPTPEKVEHR